ncbi:MAG: hypothetical protein EHM27_11795 [Deltaproteobacteria bacterium]|nr:MAG: hypothetical protein EHM27_11795 [Deltaproteobacteria bacterium]
MNKKLMISTFLFILFLGGLMLGSAMGQEKTGKPIIQDSFAAKQISPYETWKVYLRASDPDGSMRNIYAVVEQPGVGPYPLSITRIKAENQKELSGYVYLNTSGADSSGFNYAQVSLTIWVQDRSGKFSESVNFTLSLNNRYQQAPPPPGKFQENDLGPILVRLRTLYDSSKPWNFD